MNGLRSMAVTMALPVLMVACNTPGQRQETGSAQDTVSQETSEMVDMHNAENSLDIAGVYQGTLPCADCEGIEVVLTLQEDNTYEREMTYLGYKKGNVFTDNGNWSVSENTVTLEKATEGPNAYFAGENTLTQLDMEGNRIEGDLADMYILRKN